MNDKIDGRMGHRRIPGHAQTGMAAPHADAPDGPHAGELRRPEVEQAVVDQNSIPGPDAFIMETEGFGRQSPKTRMSELVTSRSKKLLSPIAGRIASA